MKHKTISRRLSIEIILLILSFSLVLLIANSLLLKPLYYASVEKNMIEGINALSALDYEDETQNWVESIRSIDPGHSYDITLEYLGLIIYSSSMDLGIRGIGDSNPGDDNPNTGFESNPFPDEFRPKFREPFFPGDKVDDWRLVEDQIFFGTLNADKDRGQLFVSKMELDNGMTIYLTQGIEPILNSVKQANILLMSVTGIFLIIAAIIAFKMSRNFTKPIRTMQQHVDRLSRLDFDDVLKIETGDELENLSLDINQLSNRLQEALSTLKAQNEQLEKDIRSQRKFISNASHELRTPLSLIKGYADEIVQGYVKDMAQQQVYVGYIAEESTKMKRLLNEILELSRLESGRMTFNMATWDVKQSILSFVDKYSGFIEDQELNLTLDLVPMVATYDMVRFEQILANYLSNSGKYCDHHKAVHIRNQDMGETVRIYVTNTGGPILQEVMDYLWDGFYKADEARTTREGSYGLGLSVVKAIQEATHQAYGCFNDAGLVTFWFDVAKEGNLELA